VHSYSKCNTTHDRNGDLAIAAFLAVFAVPLLAWVPVRERYQLNFLATMGEFGTMHWDPDHTLLLPSPMPWMRLLVFCGISMGLLWVALTVTERQDF